MVNAGPPVRHDTADARTRAAESARDPGARRLRRPQDQDLLRRPEAPPRRGHRADAPPPAPLPRRADHRARPPEPGPDVARGPPAAPLRHHRLPHHPLSRGGRRALRPHRHHRPRQDRRRGHPRGGEVQVAGDIVLAGTDAPTAPARAILEGKRSSASSPRRTGHSASTSTAARPRPPRSSGSWTGRGSRCRPSPSTGPAWTTSSSARPAARSARRRHDRRTAPPGGPYP